MQGTADPGRKLRELGQMERESLAAIMREREIDVTAVAAKARFT
jgi:hypothetical protein